jgi:hypothetical protein
VVIRFRFRLRPIAEVSPWGPDRRLHWFGLTDGWYWIEIDGLELLRYAPQAVQGWTGDGPGAATPYVDYYVARLWEDMLSLLPAVLAPVPDDLTELMSSDPGDWASPDEARTEAAAEWYGSHMLDMGYIRCPPAIRWWRRAINGDDRTIVAWQHRSGEIKFTAPRTGQATVPTSEFVGAVEELNRELLSAMEERISGLERSGPPPGVGIDLQQLRAEHQDRVTWLRHRSNQAPTTDWTGVREGAAILLRR